MCLRDQVSFRRIFRWDWHTARSEGLDNLRLQQLPGVVRRVIVSVGLHTVLNRSSERQLREDCVHAEIGGDIAIVLLLGLSICPPTMEIANAPRLRPSAAVNTPQHIGRWPKTSSFRTFSLNRSTSFRIRESCSCDSSPENAASEGGWENPFEYRVRSATPWDMEARRAT